MTKVSEQVAAPALVDGGETNLHSHAGGGGGATLTVAETEVFNGTAPTTWTDLDLSGVVGVNHALVVLKFTCASSFGVRAFRKNGDTDEFYQSTSSSRGCAVAGSDPGDHSVMLVATDALGIIEWFSEDTDTLVIDIIAYIK